MRFNNSLKSEKKVKTPSKGLRLDKNEHSVSIFSSSDILDTLPIGLYVKDKKGCYIYTNHTLNTMLSFITQPILGKKESDIFAGFVLRKSRQKLQYNNYDSSCIQRIFSTRVNDKDYLFVEKTLPHRMFGAGLKVGSVFDITSLEFGDKKTQHIDSYLQKINELTPYVTFVFNIVDDTIYKVNLAFEKMLGYSIDELNPRFWRSIISSENSVDKEKFFSKFSKLNQDEVMVANLCYTKKEGGKIWTKTSVTPFDYAGDGRIKSVMVSIENIHSMKLLQEKLEKESHFDHLTKIYNRRFFVKKLKQAILKKKPFTILFIDLDNFKSVNDTHGHDIGDKILIDTAHKLQSIFKRKTDIVARLGGDEFVVLINGGLQDKFNATIKNQLHTIFVIPYNDNGLIVSYRPSVGAVLVKENYNTTPEVVLNKADKAMYKAKRCKMKQLSPLKIISV